MKSKIYDVIESGNEYPGLNKAYTFFMLSCIILSLIPLGFKESTMGLVALDRITVTIFIIDYILRLITADYKYGRGAVSYVKYPFSPMAIIDLLAILPSLTVVNRALIALRMIRAFRFMRVVRLTKTIRIAKIARYSKSASILGRVIIKSKDSLLMITALAFGYILATALIIFNVEPQTFETFFDALYWATISLTTVGYGDIYAVSIIGRVITMISSFVGIAIIALPSGIITAEYVRVLESDGDPAEDDEGDFEDDSENAQ